jgi:inosine/xanthosine triphosphate pyrophosphatase family protein
MLGLWLTASDLVGRVQIPVEELMKTPNKMILREDSLMGFEDANDMPGTLSSFVLNHGLMSR